MEEYRDLEVAQIAALAGAKMIKAYISELRRRGRIKGRLTIMVTEGKKKYEFLYRDNST